MEFISCSNCLNVFDDSRGECEHCGANTDGERPRFEFDTTTRAAIRRYGGIYGGILEAHAGAHVLWCSRGICYVEETVGLAWGARAFGTVEDVSVRADAIVVTVDGQRTLFAIEDGSELETGRTPSVD